MFEKWEALILIKKLDFNALKFFWTFGIGGAYFSSNCDNHFDFTSQLNYLFKKFEELFFFPLLIIQVSTLREVNKITIA